MSILDALRVQKANQQSVSQLAMLPQKEIIRLAQLGHIPADVVPVVISEKARMAQESAQMKAASQMQQQGGQMPTVIEQAMQANAQAEMPEPGLAGLPTEQMFQGQNFQSGGIVAFNGEDGSFVEGPTGLKMLREEADGDKKRPSSLAEMISQVKGLATEARRETPEETALREARKKGVLSPEDIKQQQYMRLLQAGLGIMGGTSPYALTNIGAGAQEALKGYAEDVKSQRALQMENLKAAAETARAKRGEEMQDIALGAQLYGQQVDREQRERIAKESQLGAKYADNYVAMKRTQGDKRPEEVIRDEGYNKFFENYGYASQRAQIGATTAAGQQALGYAGLTERYIGDARTSVDKALSDPGSQESRDFRRMRKDDPTLTMDDYRQSLVLKRANEAAAAARAMQEQGVGTPQQRPAAPSAQPSKPNISAVTGAPAGSKVGNFVQGRGWEVLGSDGKLIGYVQQ